MPNFRANQQTQKKMTNLGALTGGGSDSVKWRPTIPHTDNPLHTPQYWGRGEILFGNCSACGLTRERTPQTPTTDTPHTSHFPIHIPPDIRPKTSRNRPKNLYNFYGLWPGWADPKGIPPQGMESSDLNHPPTPKTPQPSPGRGSHTGSMNVWSGQLPTIHRTLSAKKTLPTSLAEASRETSGVGSGADLRASDSGPRGRVSPTYVR